MDIYRPVYITEEILNNFRPTRLYIKELHGIKYFGKTFRDDVFSYAGSGKYWKSLILKYGKENIKTLWISEIYYDPELLQEVALSFSRENDIVNSHIWANLIPENGLSGGYNRFSKTALELSVASRKKLYGSGWGQAHTPEARLAANETRKLLYGSSMGMCHTSDAKDKSLKTRIERYGNAWGAANSAVSREKAKKTRNQNNENGWYTMSEDALSKKKLNLSKTNSRVGAERVSRPEVLLLDKISKLKEVKLGRGWKSRPTSWIEEKIKLLQQG